MGYPPIVVPNAVWALRLKTGRLLPHFPIAWTDSLRVTGWVWTFVCTAYFLVHHLRQPRTFQCSTAHSSNSRVHLRENHCHCYRSVPYPILSIVHALDHTQVTQLIRLSSVTSLGRFAPHFALSFSVESFRPRARCSSSKARTRAFSDNRDGCTITLI